MLNFLGEVVVSSKSVDFNPYHSAAASTTPVQTAATSASQFVPASAPGRHPTDASMRTPNSQLRIDKRTSGAPHTVIRGQYTGNEFHLVGTLNEAETQSAFSKTGIPSLGKLVLGTGSARVRLAYYDDRESGKQVWVAVKKMTDIDVAYIEIERHLDVQRSLPESLFVVKLIDYAITEGKDKKSKAYLFMEWSNPGYQIMNTTKKDKVCAEHFYGGQADLAGFVNHASQFPFYGSCSAQEAVRKVAWACVAAVNDFHKAGLVHRDIKSENFYCNHSGQVKLGDYASVGLRSDSALSSAGWTPQSVPYHILKEIGSQAIDKIALTWSAQELDRFALGRTLLDLRTYCLHLNEQRLVVSKQNTAISTKKVLRNGCFVECWVGFSVDPASIRGDTLDEVIALLMYNEPGGRTVDQISRSPYFTSF